MKMFSDCAGRCEDCFCHFVGGCLAGHGDDDFQKVTEDDLYKTYSRIGLHNVDRWRKEIAFKRFPNLYERLRGQ